MLSGYAESCLNLEMKRSRGQEYRSLLRNKSNVDELS